MDTQHRPQQQEDGAHTRRPTLLRRFTRNRKGSVAVEFGMLALPFSLLVFAVLESSISFGAQQVLTNATDEVARKFRTGQLKPADLQADEDKIRDLICARLEIVVTTGCPGLVVDLKRYDTFADAAARRITYGSDGDIDTTGFSTQDLGQAQSKNQLRVFYRWPVITDFMRRSMSTLPDGKTLHFASVTWQNEPFDD